MSKRKKRVLITSVCLGIILVVCTFVSFQVYKTLLPKVRTITHQVSDLGHLNIQRITWFVPMEAVMSSEGHDVLYRVVERSGRFGEEYYAEEVPMDIFYENGEMEIRESDGYLRVVAPLLYSGEQVIVETSGPLKNGDTVLWINPQSVQN